jgi:hypothetical protein
MNGKDKPGRQIPWLHRRGILAGLPRKKYNPVGPEGKFGTAVDKDRLADQRQGLNGHRQFFRPFPDQGFFPGFPVPDFAPGEFPFTPHIAPGKPPGGKYLRRRFSLFPQGDPRHGYPGIHKKRTG